MKNNENLKIKILLSLVLLVIISIVTYISLPYIGYALENASNNFLENVSAITNPPNEVTMDKVQIHEHRGYGIWAAGAKKDEAKIYKDAENNTGISDINDFISKYLSPKIAINKSYGWLYALQYGTSIFCQESGRTFPSLNGRKLYGFHLEDATGGHNWVDTNEDVYPGDSSKKYTDFTELIPDLACGNAINVHLTDYEGSIEPKTTSISEKDILDLGGTGYGFFIKNFSQLTTVRVRYTANPRIFDTIESYIFSYSLRNWYTYNPAQYALWKYKNGVDIPVGYYAHSDADTIEKGQKLYKSAKAVNELSNPTKPQMSTTSATVEGVTYSTGTVLDGEYYKVGPIKMNSYSYGWTENIKEFSGQSSLENPDNATLLAAKTDEQKEFFKGIVAGIIEAKVKLDSGDEIILNKDNFIIEDASVITGTEFYSCPTKDEGYEYPTPGSTFYIKLPISECVDATKIEKVTMKYKWHTADGNGGDLTGKFDELTWKTWKDDGTQERMVYNSTQYYCTNHDSDGTACVKQGSIRSTYAKVTNADTNGTATDEEATDGSISYNVNAWAHNFNCGATGWCQYGSSTGSTSSAAYTYGTIKSTTKISDKCSYTWNCGYNAHRCDNNYSDFETAGGSIIDGCVCPHKHSDSCYRLDCPLDDGELICDKSEHTHSKSTCNTSDCSHKTCTCKPKGNETTVTCTHEHGSGCCSKTAHKHSDSNGCYHYHTNMDGSCYTRICGHTGHGGRYSSTESSSCVKLPGTCKYKKDSNTENATHVHTNSCSRTHDCTKNYCTHGFGDSDHDCYQYYVSYTDTSNSNRNKMHESSESACEAENWGDDHIGRCYGELGVGTKCVAHGVHRNCMKYYWYLRGEKTKDSQKLMYVSDAQVYEHNEECYIGEIPLITKVEIDKYIYDVEHAVDLPDGVDDDTFGPSDVRRELDEAKKEENPVYVESDDYVIYRVVMKNSSAFGVKIKVDDILPADGSYEFISADLGTKKIEGDIEALRNETIVINAESEASITITLQVKVLEGTYVNKARIITRNETPKNDTDNIDYIRTVDDDGPIVNHIETKCNGTTNAPEWESSDWFILNNYNTFIDKYVYKYDEKKQKENNNTLLITKEDSIVKSGNVLNESRLNTKTTTKKVSDGNLEDTIRINNMVQDANGNNIAEHELYKSNHPVNVEKYETVTYAIRVYNDATKVENTEDSGDKTPTKFKVSTIEDKLHNGLQYSSIKATIFKEDGTKKVANVLGVECTLDRTEGDYNIYNITTSTDTVIEPGEYIEFYMAAKVVQSNMYLFEMNNEAKIKKISNINNIDVTERNISEQDETTEYIRMKDLVISGKVWVDFNKDGLMNDTAESDIDKINNNINDAAMKEDILVRLYQVDSEEKATLIRTTRTDENGLYTFARNENLSWYETYNNTKDYSSTTKYQRIDKANNKDANGKYTADSEYNRYYVEFVYDGVVYKSTEIYAGVSNLTQNDGRYNEKYLIDSNAAELEKDREAFNKNYEYISYNVGYDLNDNKKKGGDLVFQKDGHSSILMEDPQREMTAKSFLLKYNTDQVLKACNTAIKSCTSSKWKSCSNHWDEWQVVIAMGLIDDSKYANTKAGRLEAQKDLTEVYNTLKNNAATTGNTQMINYLWLYSFNSGVDRTTPETDYLKYINLGLELREDVDLALSKDVYKVKTTINGEEMEYDYNLGDTLDYTNPYIVKKPYGFEVYESDYKYRVEQYISHAVEQFKGNGADELNIEVTYRINLQNVNTPDRVGGSANTKLDARIHEVLDLYDENFKDITDSAVTAKVKDANGLLIDKQIAPVEAWMFMTKAQAAGKELLEAGKTYSIRNSEEGGKHTYVFNPDGEYVKVKLNVSNTTDNYSNKKDNSIAADAGYKVAYITGMGDIIIPEGGSIDIYVKYLVNKDATEIIVSESYEETRTASVREYVEETGSVTTTVVENDNMTTIITNIKSDTRIIEGEEKIVTVANLARSIKLADRIKGQIVDKGSVGRGTENIAQINAYSIWYTDGDPASLVDMDSNAGNIGIKNTSTGKSPNGSGYSETTTSVDDVTYYEDMTYKTGIEIAGDGTENRVDEVNKRYKDPDNNEIIIIERIPDIPPPEISIRRTITGMVWDDSRSTTLGGEAADAKTAQYIGNGMYDPEDDRRIEQAKANDNVKHNYKDASVTEDKDIVVSNAKAEFIEVININGKYYEEVLTDVTWDYKQNARTDENGEYTLYGFIPGTYIVRFTYGDYINIPEDIATMGATQKDMLIFNGQDYKSTQYTGADESLDVYKDTDKIIVEFNDKHESDARDDEIRRLEVNNYSEIMTNDVAEILKGLANSKRELTPSSSENKKPELEALVRNTYMTADTREFLVEPEKVLDDSQKLAYKGENGYVDSLPYYKYMTSLRNEHIGEREFKISNVDLGIEYRPESEINLMKEIVQLTLITENNEILVDLHFDTKNVGNKITHVINEEKSIGFELVQFISNEYKPKSLINNIVSEEDVQGLVYVQIDEEILQGCTVKITYGFNAQNCSEVDRISKNLNAIRYRDNQATDKLIESYKNKYAETKPEVLIGISNIIEGKYTASAMAKTAVFADSYDIDDDGLVYRVIPKTVTTNGDDGYYGRFVGYGYHTGEKSDLDEIASLKFDKILDYIDTNLEYEPETTTEEVIDRLWTKITSRELINLVSHYKGLRNTVSSMTDEELPKITDINGIEYKSMVVSVDDRNVDPGDPNEVGIKAESIKNKDLSRFLIPKVVAVGLNGNDDTGKENDKKGKPGYDDYTGHIFLEVSKVLAAGSEDDDKTYENIAEIVQFTTLTGRRTNFATTIGNANIHDIKDRLDKKAPPFDGTTGDNPGSIEFITSSIEPDTSATETITLIPPTGLMRSRRPIVSLMETAKAGVEVMSMAGLVVAIVAGAAFLVILVIRKYKKRRIK